MLPGGLPFLVLCQALLLLRLWRIRLTAILASVAFVLAVDALHYRPAPLPDDGRPELVILIGIDGLTHRALGLGNTPVLDKMATEGVQALAMQAVQPTMSSPNWASILMGAEPQRHGVRTNAWRRKKWADVSLCDRPIGAGWPSIFELTQVQRPGAWTVVVHDWIGIARLVPRAHVDRRRFRPTQPMATRTTLRQLRKRNPPLLTFLHLDHVDKAGQSHGFDSWQYHQAVSEADTAVGRILEQLDDTELTTRSLVAVVSDHGGRGRGHGGPSPEETLVPWILWGRGVQPGLSLSGPLSVSDTAPSLAYALGLEVPTCWTGRALRQAFQFSPR